MLKKTASFIKLSAIIDNETDYNRAVSEMIATATDTKEAAQIQAKKVVKYNPEFVYARFKAIGALEIDGPNANADAFPYGEFLDTRPGYGYKSFIGKHAYVEHASDNVSNAIGDLYGAYLNRFNTKETDKDWVQLSSDERMIILANRKPHEDGSIEVLMAVDRKAAPRIARMIDTDSPTGCSMGTNIDYSECTVCGNRAHVEEQYCPHIKFSKGQNLLVPAQQISDLLKKGTLQPEWLPFILSRKSDIKAVKTASRKMVYAKAFEINYGLSFFELSVVANPAFHRGYKLEKIAKITKPSFKQLKPFVVVGGKPVEVIFNVTDEFYDDVLRSYGEMNDVSIDDWSREERILFDRDGEIAQSALKSGNVLEVLANKAYAPYFVKSDVELTPSDDAGYYNVVNPEELFSKTFAKVTPRRVFGTIGTKYSDFYMCPVCHMVYDRKTHQKTSSINIKDFSKFSICKKCGDIINKGDSNVAKEEKNARKETEEKTAEYKTLPTTSEFTGDKPPTEGDSRKGETKLYHGWAEKGAKQIEKEKKTRPHGTIFIDAVVAKKSLNDRASRIKDLKASIDTLLNRTKLAMHSPEDFMSEMDEKPFGKGFGPGPMMDGDDEDIEGIAIEIELEPADVPEVLENTKTDLELIKEDLEMVSEMVEGKEEEAKDALANKLRWGRRSAFGAKKIAEDADTVIEEAVSAIDDAILKLDKAYNIYKSEGGTEEEEGTEKSSEESAEPDIKETDNKSKGDDDMAKEAKEGAKLEITDANIELLQKLTGLVASSTRVEKTSASEEKEEEEKEEEEKEDKEEKREDKEEKKEAKVSKEEKTADTKEAAAMPPTGARDPGDYGEAGAVESHEMSRWWQDMYPEYQKIKSVEESTSLVDPETKVELLTGDVGTREGANDAEYPGKEKKAPTIYSSKLVVKKFANAWEPRKSFYGVVKVADDSSVEAFTANFNDVAGDDGGKAEFDIFNSDEYATEIVNTVKDHGIEAARKQMNGKVAQLEGITPGKTSKTPQALYDTQEGEKDSGKGRESMRPDTDAGHKGDDGYYNKAFGDDQYASALKKAETKIAQLEQKNADLEAEKKAGMIAKRAIHLARFAASRGTCPFDLKNIQALAKEYIQLDDKGLKAVKSHLEKLPVVDQRALEAYQIPEAEEMGAGVVHNIYTGVRDVRYEGGKGEDVAPEGIQDAVHQNAKVSDAAQEKVRKQAQSVAPQIHTNGTPTGTDNNGIPDVTKHFNTIENRLKRAGKFEEFKHLLRSNRR